MKIEELVKEAMCPPSSDLVKIANRPEYRKVVDLGYIAIPFILSKMSIIWDLALKEITGVKLPDNLDTNQRVAFWKKWAKENNY